MTLPLSTQALDGAVPTDEPPPGMLEFHARSAIRDLIRLHGFEAARELVALYLNDEADRKPRQ